MAETIQNYLALSTEYFELREAFASSIPIAADVPFVFAASQFPEIANTPFNGETKILHRHVQDIFDSVTLLDYRDFALGIDSIEFHAQPWLEYGSQIGRPVEIGVETSPNPINKVTFDEEGAAFMETQLALAESQFLDDPAFDGFSIHHFGSYRTLVFSEAVQADFDSNGFVDSADYALWLGSLGQTGGDLAADANDDLIVDQLDYLIWKANFGTSSQVATANSLAIPEPASLYLLFLAVGFGIRWRPRDLERQLAIQLLL